ncbi:MAG: DNA translocase FtsK 4TM domain-containing protein [Proteobacteria bacterium]|nr:DNA translocase FtsK 4TM domain-containing protein [Pseudomonadota bacterium]
MAALVSLQAGDGTLMGPLGRTIASIIYGFAGLCSYVLVAMLVVVAIRLLIDRPPLLHPGEAMGLVLGLASLAALLHLAGADYRVAGHSPGGLVGDHVAEVFRAIISTAGTALVAGTGLIIALVIATPLRVRQLGGHLLRAARHLRATITRIGKAAGHFCGEVIRAILPERERDEYLDADSDEYDEYDAFGHETTDPGAFDPPIIEHLPVEGESVAAPADQLAADTEKVADQPVQRDRSGRQVAAAASASSGNGSKSATSGQSGATVSVTEEADEQTTEQAKQSADKPVSGKKKRRKPPAVIVEDDDDETLPAEADTTPAGAGGENARPIVSPSGIPASSEGPGGVASPVIVESQFKQADAAEMKKKEKEVDAERLELIPIGDTEYKLPPIHLLDYDESQRDSIDRTSMLELSARLARTLQDYGVKGEVVAIRPGPVVTMYEFSPAPGTRINKIVNLSDDLAMVLEALSVRIVAPIPGKAAVGIEVPNKARETVYLKEIIADKVFQKGRHKLPLALGKNIEGAPAVVDLAKMPHLLVAGTTGSGKSVSINAMITSLLYSSTPADVRLIMVDPKMLELSIYEGIPHLLLPVVTDPKKANLALRWGVEEMERRYDLLASMGVRDVGNYNKKAEKLRALVKAEKLRRAADEAQRFADGTDHVEVTEERSLELGNVAPEHLPYIVIIIDEFADLMMCAPKEVETSVARIAQKARAAGIHLILATQRPSVDVITGLIKANFPSRAAFRVTAKVDSRTILDQMGAEALLGAGDMLFSDRGTSPRRFHGCFVAEGEIYRIVEFLRKQGKPVYDMDILRPRDDESSGDEGNGGEGPVDAMYDQAVALVAETRQVSISMIQRRLRVGYNRAARMVEQMERQGVISPPDHTNKREVLIQPAA